MRDYFKQQRHGVLRNRIVVEVGIGYGHTVPETRRFVDFAITMRNRSYILKLRMLCQNLLGHHSIKNPGTYQGIKVIQNLIKASGIYGHTIKPYNLIMITQLLNKGLLPKLIVKLFSIYIVIKITEWAYTSHTYFHIRSLPNGALDTTRSSYANLHDLFQLFPDFI